MKRSEMAKKSQWNIKTYRPGSRLRGREAQCLYRVIDDKGHVLMDGFPNKKSASAWLGQYVRDINNARREKLR